jgi:hypothetical protein
MKKKNSICPYCGLEEDRCPCMKYAYPAHKVTIFSPGDGGADPCPEDGYWALGRKILEEAVA